MTSPHLGHPIFALALDWAVEAEALDCDIDAISYLNTSLNCRRDRLGQSGRQSTLLGVVFQNPPGLADHFLPKHLGLLNHRVRAKPQNPLDQIRSDRDLEVQADRA